MQYQRSTLPFVLRTCGACAEWFIAKRQEVERGNGRFCSRRCAIKIPWTPSVDPLHARFWAKVDKHGPPPEYAPELGPCWIWRGAVGKAGYAHFSVMGKKVNAHRWAYQHFVNAVPVDFVVDHLCRVRRCVNYERHLEAVPRRVNTMRGMSPGVVASRQGECKLGHQLTARTGGARAGRFECRVCQKAARQKW